MCNPIITPIAARSGRGLLTGMPVPMPVPMPVSECLLGSWIGTGWEALPQSRRKQVWSWATIACMDLLILGGTRFLGRAFVTTALAHGHTVTLFNRGRTDPHAFPQVETITGDREVDLSALSGRNWDAVIDTSAYAASTARRSAEALSDHADRYVFISTISVYADAKTPNFDESYPLAVMSEEDAAMITGNADVNAKKQFYGPQKVLCERVVTHVFGEQALIVRAGLLIGPYDVTDRFGYWVRRVAEGGEMLVPDTPDQRWQLIDARDLAGWALAMLAKRRGGIFNVTGERLRMADILETCRRLSGSDVHAVRVSERFIADEQIGEWDNLPLWIPSDSVDYAGLWACNIDKALSSGLTLRPISDTIYDSLAWDAARDWPKLALGLTRAREQELMTTWKRQLNT